MPHYFFNVKDEVKYTDYEGLQLLDEQAAQKHALRLVTIIADGVSASMLALKLTVTNDQDDGVLKFPVPAWASMGNTTPPRDPNDDDDDQEDEDDEEDEKEPPVVREPDTEN